MSKLLPHSRPQGRLHEFSPVDLSTNWKQGAIVKAKAVRIAALSGAYDFTHHGVTFPQCTGFIELVGARVGLTSTSLLIGFTLAEPAPPFFSYLAGEAMGALSLPAHQFGAFATVTSSPNVYFRLGGDGSCNAVANDASILK